MNLLKTVKNAWKSLWKVFLRAGRPAPFLAAYAAALLLWLLQALFFFIGDAARPALTLDPAGAKLSNVAEAGPGLYRTEGADPQMIFERVEARVRTLRLEAEFESAPGELELFYTRGAGAGFSARRRVIGVPQNDGSVLYTLPPGYVRALRLDPGSGGGNTVHIRAVTLNPPLPALRYFVPGPRALAALLVLPALALCLVYTVKEAFLWIRMDNGLDEGVV